MKQLTSHLEGLFENFTDVHKTKHWGITPTIDLLSVRENSDGERFRNDMNAPVLLISLSQLFQEQQYIFYP
jgi:hypothetical protein